MDQKRSLAPFGFFIAFAFCLLLHSSRLQIGQESLAADRSNWKTEWEKTLKAARVEAQVVGKAAAEARRLAHIVAQLLDDREGELVAEATRIQPFSARAFANV